MKKSPKYVKHISTQVTPQSEPIPGSKQVQNSAGGYAYQMDDWKRLDRFLILGSEGGTYYTGERKLTIENARCVERCLQLDAMRTVTRIVEISESGRAPKNEPAILALAVAASSKDLVARNLAYTTMPRVCRIGTHLFHWLAYVQEMRSWSRGLRGAVSNWYEQKPAKDLAYQLIKYRQRDGWTHRDVLRLAHVQRRGSETEDRAHKALYRWVVAGDNALLGERTVVRGKPPLSKTFVYASVRVQDMPELIPVFAVAQVTTDVKQLSDLIREHRLPREAIPTAMLTRPEVWDALLEQMPMEAMLRNLATMSKVGLLVPRADAVSKVLTMLSSKDAIKKSRLHPLKVLAALTTYAQGRGLRSSAEWKPVPQIVDALNEAFYLAFGNVVPTNKNIMLALDVSGSMSSGEIAGVGGITPRVGAAAMALVTARVEPNYEIMAFSDRFVPLSISPKMRLDDVVRKTSNLAFSNTDCAQPMLYAMKQRGAPAVDAFAVITDSETWAGAIHPMQALKQYRQKTGVASKLIVVGMTSTEFTIGDPEDGGCLDCVGFDSATPQLISDFIAEP